MISTYCRARIASATSRFRDVFDGPARTGRGAGTLVVGVALCASIASVRGAGQETLDPDAVAARVGAYVEGYFATARTVTAREFVVLEPLDDRLRPRGSRRTLAYDVRLEWAPEPGAIAPPRVHRHLVEMDGRSVDDDGGAVCLAPESSDPLAFLLPDARAAYSFGPVQRIGGDDGPLAIDYMPVAPGPPGLTWYGDCGTFHLPGRIRGRVVVDPRTSVVRRLESSLVGPVEIPVPEDQRRSGWGRSITAARIDVRIEYAPVAFEDPDEVLWLPASVERVTVVMTPEPRRLRVRQVLSEYRRFHTAIRVLPQRF